MQAATLTPDSLHELSTLQLIGLLRLLYEHDMPDEVVETAKRLGEHLPDDEADTGQCRRLATGLVTAI